MLLLQAPCSICPLETRNSSTLVKEMLFFDDSPQPEAHIIQLVVEKPGPEPLFKSTPRHNVDHTFGQGANTASLVESVSLSCHQWAPQEAPGTDLLSERGISAVRANTWPGPSPRLPMLHELTVWLASQSSRVTSSCHCFRRRLDRRVGWLRMLQRMTCLKLFSK